MMVSIKTIGNEKAIDRKYKKEKRIKETKKYSF